MILDGLLQVCKRTLQLSQHKFGCHLWLNLLRKFCLEDSSPELGYHEHLLNQAVHVASATKVTQAYIA